MHVEIQPTEDMWFIDRMVNHPSISPHVRDDRVRGFIDCSPLVCRDNVFLKVLVNGDEAGFAALLHQDGSYELHSGMLPEFRGAIALEAGRRVIDWIVDNTDTPELTTWAWEHARHVRLMVLKLGFQETGRRDWSFTVNGQLVRRVDFSLNLRNPEDHLSKFNQLASCL